MFRSTAQTEPTLIERYQNYRTRRFLKHERSYANTLPGWRTQSRRRTLVLVLAFAFAFMFAVSLLCAFGIGWAPLLWLPACLVFFPAWIVLQIVSGRQGDCPLPVMAGHRQRSEQLWTIFSGNVSATVCH